MKKLIITEKPSVADEFMKILEPGAKRRNGKYEGDKYIITWCIGHLMTLCMPERYGEQYEKWSLEVLPFIPEHYKYEAITSVKEQLSVVTDCIRREDIDTIYYAGDAAREGEYIQRLIRAYAARKLPVIEKRVWIDSQTEEEIRKGVAQAKPLADYDKMSDSGYMRAIEDYLIGINFSRALTLKYGKYFNECLSLSQYTPISVGRVMTCVLGMIVERERQIRNAVEIPFYGVNAIAQNTTFGWKATEKSEYSGNSLLFKQDAFSQKETAEKLCSQFNREGAIVIKDVKKGQEKKNPPLLFNLAEAQNECSKLFKISPDQTLNMIQSLYDKKMVTYPRTDARVLSSAVAKEIRGNLLGLRSLPETLGNTAGKILESGAYKNIEHTKYTDDSKISDHYAIIPTGKTEKLSDDLEREVYELIVKRFLSIFCPAAVYEKISIIAESGKEEFFATAKVLRSAGWLELYEIEEKPENENKFAAIAMLNEGASYPAKFEVVKGTTSAPPRYNSGSMILAMENAGNLIEEEELREQIKGSGIGTSATRAETIKKLIKNGYIRLDEKTQILRPTAGGEIIFEIVQLAVPSLLSPKMTASWEKGLTAITEGAVSKNEYQEKLNVYVSRTTNLLKEKNVLSDAVKNIEELRKIYREIGERPINERDSYRKIHCPICGRSMYRKDWGYGCTGFSEEDNKCGFRIFRKQYGKELTEEQMELLVTNGKTRKMQFTSKKGTKYSAVLYIDKEEKAVKMEFPKEA